MWTFDNRGNLNFKRTRTKSIVDHGHPEGSFALWTNWVAFKCVQFSSHTHINDRFSYELHFWIMGIHCTIQSGVSWQGYSRKLIALRHQTDCQKWKHNFVTEELNAYNSTKREHCIHIAKGEVCNKANKVCGPVDKRQLFRSWQKKHVLVPFSA